MKREDLKLVDDLGLIKLALAGNNSAFEILVHKYESMIAKITISMIGNKDEADDIGQEVFIRFYRSMDKFKGDSKLGTYLARMAINLTLNEIKKRQKRWLSIIPNYQDIEVPSNVSEESKDITSVVNTSLSKLEPKFRSVVVLRNIQGFSTKETAEILNLPQGTVLSRLSRGHEKLKDILIKMDAI